MSAVYYDINCGLLRIQMLNKSSPEGRLKMSELSKHVAAAVGDIVQAAEQIKGLCLYHSVQLSVQQIIVDRRFR